MATLEERATKYADLAKEQTFFDERAKDVAANFAYTHYCIGANEQKKIDIEKAVSTYIHELEQIIDLLNKVGMNFNADNLGEILSVEGCVIDFRKALEE